MIKYIANLLRDKQVKYRYVINNDSYKEVDFKSQINLSFES